MIFTFVIENQAGENRRIVTAEDGDSILLAPDEDIHLAGNDSGETSINRLQQSGSDLIMFFDDGSHVVLSGFYPADSEAGDEDIDNSRDSGKEEAETASDSLEQFGNPESDGGFTLIRRFGESSDSRSGDGQNPVDSQVNPTGSLEIGGGSSSGDPSQVEDPAFENVPGVENEPRSNSPVDDPSVKDSGKTSAAIKNEQEGEADDETGEVPAGKDPSAEPPATSRESANIEDPSTGDHDSDDCPQNTEEHPANRAPAVLPDAFSGQIDHHSGAYRFEESNPPSDPGGGDLKRVTTTFDPADGTLEFEMVVADPGDSTADGFTLALNDGPNPTGLAGELALFYFDASGAEPVVSVYGYNGENVLTSFEDGSPEAGIQTPDRIASTPENDHPFSEISVGINSEGDRVFRFTVDAAEIKGHPPLHPGASEWTGAQFDDLLSTASVRVNINGLANDDPGADSGPLADLLDGGDGGEPLEVNTKLGGKMIEPDYGGEPDQGAAAGPVAGQGSSALSAAEDEAAAAAAGI